MSKLTKLLYLIIIIFVFFYFTAGKKILKSFSKTKKDYQYLTLFSEIVSKTKSEYFEDIKPGEKFPGAFTAMLGYLDRVSAYLDARQTKIYDLYREGTHYNCGVYGTKLSNYFYISDIVPASPAEEAGLKPGDRIKSIRGDSIYSLPFYQMYLNLLSDKPEDFEISVLRGNSKKTEKVTIKTRLSQSKSRVKRSADDIFIVEIPKIDEESAAYLQENLPGQKHLKLIIDLRKYCGGDFESLLKIGNIFFNKSADLSVTLQKKEAKEDFPVGSENALDYQAVVIVNKSTIMYGELLAALFKKYKANKKDKITIIGRKTPGFISKVKHIKFADGSSILLSEGFYLIRDKQAAKSGVKPHVELKEKEFDNILARSIAILNED